MNKTIPIIKILEETIQKLRESDAESKETMSFEEEIKDMLIEINKKISKIEGAVF